MSNKKRKTVSELRYVYTGTEKREDIPKDVTFVQFHSSVTEVSNYMFQDCEHLKEVILNEGLMKIGLGSFGSCKSLESITFPSTLLEINNRAFWMCEMLNNITFPTTLLTLGDYAFYMSVNLTDLVLNEGLLRIGYETFYGCVNLEHITIPSTVTHIGFGSFCTCSRLETVILNKSIQTIGGSAFAGCTSLTCIAIPHTVTEIRANTFHNCRNMREVGLHEGIQMIAPQFRVHPNIPHAFEGCSSLERITFPILSTRLDTIIQAGNYVDVENKVDEIRGPIERRGSELFISVLFSSEVYTNWIRNREILSKVNRVLAYYEMREATTLLELAFWKAKMDEGETRQSINRDEYRINIPGPVKNAILQFLNV